jgi:mono/diheme cytochrome c family protein
MAFDGSESTMRSRGLRTIALAAVLLLLVLSLSVMGCTSGDDGASEPAATPETEDTADEPASEPASDGDALVEEKCTVCHSRVRVDSAAKSYEEWQATVDRMRRNGAQLTDEEAATIVDYLSGE